MVQQQTAVLQAVQTMRHLIQTVTKMFGILLEAMEHQTQHLFVHPPALQTPVLVVTLMHLVAALSVALDHQQLGEHGTLNAPLEHQQHNQPHQQVYIKITRSILGWLLQVSDSNSLFSCLPSFYCVSSNCGLMLFIVVAIHKSEYEKKSA